MRPRFDSRNIRNFGSAAILAIGLLIVGCASQETLPGGGYAPIPNYPVNYGKPTTQSVVDVLQRIRSRLDEAVRMQLVETTIHTPDGATTQALTMDPGAEHKFLPVQYAMGVAYSGMIVASEATGDPTFSDFTVKRFQELQKYLALGTGLEGGPSTRPFRMLLYPSSLDDCGAMTASMVRARRDGLGPDMIDTIQRSADYITKKQYRLADGTLARKRPVDQSVWADDMYMSVSLLSQMGALTNDPTYFDDACKQVLQIAGHLWVPDHNLLTHGWIGANPDNQPNYFWGRANGWCLMAMADLLEVLPESHPQRAEVLKLYRNLAKGIASMQSGTGLWHNMLDRTDTFQETSCSAIFTYAIAKGVNHGWLNSTTYGPVAEAGWNGVATRVDGSGRLSGVCIGTGTGMDYVFYYARPAADDVHGYGPVLLAGSEIIRLLENKNFTILATTRGAGSVTFIPRGDRP